MLNGLEERIGLATIGRVVPLAQEGAQRIQTAAQTLAQVVKRFQRQRQSQAMGGALQRNTRQQGNEEPAQERGGHRVAWQRVGQENGKGMTATGTVAAIGAVHTLAAHQSSGGLRGIVAVQETVPVQETDAIAALAALLFEGKSCCFNASRSRTKRKGEWGMAVLLPQSQRLVEVIFDGTPAAVLSSQRPRKGRDGPSGTSTTLTSQLLLEARHHFRTITALSMTAPRAVTGRRPCVRRDF